MTEPDDDRDAEDRTEKFEMDEAVEKHRSSGGQADKAGVGDAEGEGEEALVKGEDGENEV